MRKITLFMMTLMMAGSLFAYEPSKENVTVKRNGDFKYYERTEPYKDKGNWTKEYTDYVGWVIWKGYTVEQCVEYNYERLESSRRSYCFSMKNAINPRPDGIQPFLTKLLNERNGTDMSPEEYARNSWLKSAKENMTWAVTALPFVTEENFLTLTKEEMLAKMKAFISDCTK